MPDKGLVSRCLSFCEKDNKQKKKNKEYTVTTDIFKCCVITNSCVSFIKIYLFEKKL